MILQTHNLGFAYGEGTVLEGLDLEIPEGRITALVGPNGSGKSTILKNLARILKPSHGAVYLDRHALADLSTKAIARRMAVLPQSPEAPAGLLVRELVGYGRFPWQKPLAAMSAEDRAAIDTALRLTGLTAFANRPVGTLSGGQRQRVWIAMALAQTSPVLLLDEPTTFLDMAHQLEVLNLLERLNREEGRTIVMVVHDINHALRFAHHVILVRAGKIMSAGDPETVLTPQTLAAAFGILADMLRDPRSGKLLCVPYGLAAAQHDAARAPA
ncbi:MULTISPECIES: ABC transporter ATP-binding protein [Devosia]|uniref:Putative siderophore transport system ATP-binding protein YusV n=1 Tax=Devosia equisanguinis TaxID=2490941 RepID=A0A3S4DP82_9HYPH|nr:MULTISPECIES: ABC transporter ATP-binding protein [Devosia]ODT47482.1 MAG: iron-dicitrate transporter ATP-binding subunit [Pelagibacterium sp. SCN 63-126]ODU86112.1 MAG: iron-dicitrate transporter ATP-binding subunit [Pelagibacterium sp. SCN 63-17]OJX42810.1 MAG: iron-dicitrate transporter ATP-binding subunit [Devosia sp. 63-57]VDS04006.1 putative siderophore transport system ATP-binding protein YusV [Devosia equisanguinis]